MTRTTKPFDPRAPRAKVNVFLELHRKNRQLQELPAREQADFGESSKRLAVPEDRLSEEPLDVATLRDEARRIRRLLSRAERSNQRGAGN
ncbi:hypothetical protein ACWGKQ_47685 [Streptomyces sp. NPDC054770]